MLNCVFYWKIKGYIFRGKEFRPSGKLCRQNKNKRWNRKWCFSYLAISSYEMVHRMDFRWIMLKQILYPYLYTEYPNELSDAVIFIDSKVIPTSKHGKVSENTECDVLGFQVPMRSVKIVHRSKIYLTVSMTPIITCHSQDFVFDYFLWRRSEDL